MQNNGTQWSNDSNDIKNLNGLFGTIGETDRATNQTQERFIDKFYPFAHTARIEQLYVMESSTHENLHSNLVTAGEAAEYVEIGVRYGLKEIAWIYLAFVVGLIWQTITILKTPATASLTLLDKIFYIAVFITAIYSFAYIKHLSKFSIGALTSKVILSLYTGRLLIKVMIFGVTTYAFWQFNLYAIASQVEIFKFWQSVVGNGGFSPLATILTIIMTPFGGGFQVNAEALTYTTLVIASISHSFWLHATIFVTLLTAAPLIISSTRRYLYESNKNRAVEELKKY